MKKTKIIASPFAYASPWILATAIGILIAIVFFFAINNLQREKRIITESLFNKGQAVIRFVGAGTRASMMMAPPTSQQFQHLIEQAAGESGILYIAVADSTGKIVAHSTPGLVGTTLDHPLLAVRPDLAPIGEYQIINSEATKQKVFEIVSPFKPLMRGRGFFKRHFQEMQQTEKQGLPAGERAQSPSACQFSPGNNAWLPGENLSIVVGLDMTEQEKIIQQDRYHMLYMSIAMLLVAIGGGFFDHTADELRAEFEKAGVDCQVLF